MTSLEEIQKFEYLHKKFTEKYDLLCENIFQVYGLTQVIDRANVLYTRTIEIRQKNHGRDLSYDPCFRTRDPILTKARHANNEACRLMEHILFIIKEGKDKRNTAYWIFKGYKLMCKAFIFVTSIHAPEAALRMHYAGKLPPDFGFRNWLELASFNTCSQYSWADSFNEFLRIPNRIKKKYDYSFLYKAFTNYFLETVWPDLLDKPLMNLPHCIQYVAHDCIRSLAMGDFD